MFNKLLLWFVNTRIGKKYFGIKEGRKIIGLSGWGYAVKTGKNKYQANFATHPYIYRKLKYILAPIHFWDTLFANKYASNLNLGFDDFSVGAGGGDCLDLTASESWATKRGRAASSNVRDTSNSGADRMHATKSGADFELSRVSLITDTSALPDTATVTSGTWTVRSDANTITDTYEFVLVANTQASDTLLATGDFDQFGTTDTPTEYATRVAVSGASQTATLTLNASGRSAVSLTGFTKMGLRSNRDVDNSAPTAQNTIRVNWGTTSTFLTVNYSLPSAGGEAGWSYIF